MSPAGSDTTGSGSQANPWATIDFADRNNRLMPGDTVEIAAGTYTITTNPGINLARCSGADGAPITYTGDGIVDVSCTYVNPDPVNNPAADGSALKIYGANYLVIDGLFITGTEIPLYLSADKIEIENSRISTTALGNATSCFSLSGATNCTLHNNIFGPTPASAGSRGGSGGISQWASSSENNQIYNNDFIGIQNSAVMDMDRTGTQFKNNIIKDCSYGIWGENSTNSHENNLLYNVGVPFFDTTQQSTETTNLDPLFIDQANNDFRLQTTAAGYPANSPAIDAGVYVGLAFNGSWPDIGAFESAGTPGAPVTTVSGHVYVDGVDGSGVTVTAGAENNASTTTDASGNYTLPGMPCGSQPMSASKSGYAPDANTVTLAAGGDIINFALGTPPAPVPISRLSQLNAVAGDGTRVRITNAKIVTVSSGVFAGNAVYIEETDRTCGIKVVLPAGLSVTAGNGITLTGTLTSDANSERYIDCDTIDSNDGSTAAPKAVGVANDGATNLVGMLVKVWGSTTAGSGFVTINDGSLFPDGKSGLTVSTTGITKAIGSFLSVTGIVGKTTGAALIVRPRSDSDID